MAPVWMGRETFHFMQVQEFRDSDEHLVVSLEILQKIRATIHLIKGNDFFRESSRNMRDRVLNTTRGFTSKCAEIRLELARTRNRFVFLASSPLAYLIQENNLHETERILIKCELDLMELRSMIPELEKIYEGECAAGELD